MGEVPEIPERVQELVFAALDHAAYYLSDSPQLLSMLIVESDSEQLIPLYASRPQPANRGYLPILTDGPEPLREKVIEGRGSFEAYAIVYDGFMRRQDESEKVETVFIEAGVEGDETAWLFAQSYRPKRLFRRFREIGNIILVETTRSLLCSESSGH